MEEATKTILEVGITGAFLIVCFAVIIILYRENKKLQEKLYTDVKETAVASINAQNAVANSITNLTEKIESGRRDR